ncbi:hypothetical protein ACLEPN_37085 [Myxococcus sp. 1LA]
MTPRLAAGIVRMALLAGTEAAAITLLEVAPSVVSSRRAVRRQLARVLRRVDQLPRAAAALEALLSEWPEDRGARRVLQGLRARIEGTARPGAAPEAGSEQEVLAKLPVRKDGAQDAASWDDDGVYLIETVVGPPLAARMLLAATPSAGVMEARQGSASSALPRFEGAGPAAASLESGAGPRVEASVDSERPGAASNGAVDAERSQAANVPEAGAGGPSSAAAIQPSDASAESLPGASAVIARKSAAELPVVEEAPAASAASQRQTVAELPVVEAAPAAPAASQRKSATGLPVVGAAPTAPAVSPRKSATGLPAVGLSSAVAAVNSRKSATEIPAVVLPPSAPSSSPKSASERPAAEGVPAASDAKSRKGGTELPAVAPAVSAPPAESLKTVLEMPAVDPSVVGNSHGASTPDAPRTLVEMPAVVVQPPSLDFEARKTEVELPALGAEALPPSSGSAKTFVNGRAPLSVPWADALDDDADAPEPVERAAPPAPRRDATTFDDFSEDEVTSEAQPLLAGAAVSEAAPRPPPSAASQGARRKTPASSEALPPPATPRSAPAPDARSGTMEVSLEELEAALAAASVDAPKGGPSGAASPGAREEDADALTRSQKVEAQLIARRAWAELAQLYLKRADQAKDASLRADALARLAEVMENELHDPAGAARMYREIVELTGDRTALRDQVRLLAARGDASLVRRALDEAIRRARTARARAGALLTRGERWLHMGELKKARADFEAAESLSPGLLPVLAGMLRCVSDKERPPIAERLRVALAAAPRRSPDRVEALRVLAQIAEDSLRDLRSRSGPGARCSRRVPTASRRARSSRR